MKMRIRVWSTQRAVSCVRLFVTLWTVARQAPLFMGFSGEALWSGMSYPTPGGLHVSESNPQPLCLLPRQVL